jgi:hypothetical protein
VSVGPGPDAVRICPSQSENEADLMHVTGNAQSAMTAPLAGAGAIVFPDAVRVLLHLLKSGPALALALAYLADLRRALAPPTMDMLWETPWLEWFHAFLLDRGWVACGRGPTLVRDGLTPRLCAHARGLPQADQAQLLAAVDSVLQKMLLHDLARRSGVRSCAAPLAHLPSA